MIGGLILRLDDTQFRGETTNGFRIFKAGALDLEGTLVNLEELHYSAHREAAKKLGVTLPDNLDEVRELIPSWVGGPDLAVMQQIFDYAKKISPQNPELEKSNAQKMLENKQAAFDRQFKDAKITAREGVTRNIQMIAQLGVPFGICSVTNYLQANAIIERSGLNNLLLGTAPLLRDSVPHGKPNPDVYLMAAEQFGIKPEELLVFEDSVTCVTAGKAAGATVCAVPTAPPGEDKPTEKSI